jgi:hypothetical protein
MNDADFVQDGRDGGVCQEAIGVMGSEERLTMSFIVKREVSVPSWVHSHEEFADAVLRLCDALNQPGETYVYSGKLLKRAYYLLGWLVGDTTKQFSSMSSKARIGISLCRKHEENLALGEYVSESIRMLGVPSKRIADEPPRYREPHGAYRWLSSYSLIVSWLKAACLGLARGELTSYVPVKMGWLLTAPREFRLWFLRGLADSDGTVNLRNKSVSIITSPNTELVQRLFNSLGCHNTAGVSKGVGVVTIAGADAASIQVFNPEVLTHRRKHLEKMCNAATYQRHWPDWLEAKVKGLLCQGLDPRSIRDTLMAEDRVYVKMNTIERKRILYQG